MGAAGDYPSPYPLPGGERADSASILRAVAVALLAACAWAPALAGEPAGLQAKTLDEALKLPAKDMDIGHAALLLSKEFDAKADVAACRGKLDTMARQAAQPVAEAAKGAAAGGKGSAILGALAKQVFETHGFGLPERDGPESFLLHSVIETKRGNCLGLSILFLALCERLDLPVFAIALPSRDAGPGHVIARYHLGDDSAFADLTRRGNGLTFEQYKAGCGLTDAELAKGYYLLDLDKRLALHLLMINLAGSLTEARRNAEALALLERARRIKEDHAGLWNNVGGACFGAGDLKRAEEAFAKALAVDPRSVAPRLGIASVHFARGESEAAEKGYRAVLETDAKCAAAHHGLGAVCLWRGSFESAIEPLQKASDLRPDDAPYARDLGIALTRAGYLDRAKEALGRARKLDPNDTKTLVAAARLAQSSGDQPAAEAIANEALKADPKCADALHYLAELKSLNRMDAEAEKLLEKALLADPQHAGALYALGKREYERRRFGMAAAYLKRAVKAAPGMIESQALLGQVCQESGDWTGAIEAYSRVLQIAPSDRNARYKLCSCYMKAGKQESAIAIAQWCIEKDPRDSAAWQILGCACENLGQKDKAIEAWRKANEITPDVPTIQAALKRLGAKP